MTAATDSVVSLTELAAHIDDHVRSGSRLHSLLPEIHRLGLTLCETFAAGHVLYTFGNGGSAADAQHLAAEFSGHFQRERRPLPAVALTTDPSVLTCIGNDFDYSQVFARPVAALARPGDMVLGFSTSGNSANVASGLRAARAAGALSVLISAGTGGVCAEHADRMLLVPADSTARVQELHVLVLHLLSEIVDRWAAATEPAIQEGEQR